MAITIHKLGRLYTADLTPPDGMGVRWSTPEPMPRDDLVEALRKRGCHRIAIADAMHEADPTWAQDQRQRD